MKEIFHCQFGSFVYGTNVPTSDKDYKKVFLLPSRDILLQNAKSTIQINTKLDSKAKNSVDDIDVECFSLKQYLKLLLEGQTVALDMLFVPQEFYIGEIHPAWQEVLDNKQYFLHKGVSSFVGYARQQANRYGIRGSRVAAVRQVVIVLSTLIEKEGHLTKLKDVWHHLEKLAEQEHNSIIPGNPDSNGRDIARMFECCNRKVQEFITLKEALSIYQKLLDDYGHRALQAEKNENIDWKSLMHAVRISKQAKELLATGNITFPRPEAQLLLDIRNGKLDYKVVAEIIENSFPEMEEASKNSILPEKPRYDIADELVIKWNKYQVDNS